MPEDTFNAFISTIDNSVARQDSPWGLLSNHIECSSIANMIDTAPGDDWDLALKTAEMILDDWTSFYPELVK